METLGHPHITGLIVLIVVLTGMTYWAIHAIGTDLSGATQPTGAKLKLAGVLLVWFAIDFVLVYNAVMEAGRADLGPPNVATGMLIPVIIGIFLLTRPRIARLADAVPLAWLAGFHALRAVFGIFFLARYELGTLPEAFAFRGGYGDIAAGILGGLTAFLILLNAAPAVVRVAIVLFSIVGLGDLVLVFYTAATTLPPAGPNPPFNSFLLIPIFAVPLFILTHFIVLRLFFRDMGWTRAKP